MTKIKQYAHLAIAFYILVLYGFPASGQTVAYLQKFCVSADPFEKPVCDDEPMSGKLEIVLKDNVQEVSPDKIDALKHAMRSGTVHSVNSWAEHPVFNRSQLAKMQNPSTRAEILREAGLDRIIEVETSAVSPVDMQRIINELRLDPNIEEVRALSVPRIPNVEVFKDNSTFIPNKTPHTNDPLLPKQYAIPKIGVDKMQKEDYYGRPDRAKVWVLDTGVLSGHPDLPVPKAVPQDGNYTTSPTAKDVYGHAGHVGGIISAIPNNGIGVVGCAPYVLTSYKKVIGDKGGGDWPWVTAALLDVIADKRANPGFKVIVNMSFGGRGKVPSLARVLEMARREGILLVAATGNFGDDFRKSEFFPAMDENVLPVLSTDEDDNLSSFSNFTRSKTAGYTMQAPGSRIISTILPDSILGSGLEYAILSGTSMAAPHGVCAAALVWSDYQDLSVKQVMSLLARSGDEPLNENGKPKLAGFSSHNTRVNVFDAHASANAPPPDAPYAIVTPRTTHSLAEVSFNVSARNRHPEATLYFSKKFFEEDSLTRADVRMVKVNPEIGQDGRATVRLSNLDKGSEYLFGIKVTNVIGDTSPLSPIMSFVTKNARVLTAWNFTSADGQKTTDGWVPRHGPLDIVYELLFGFEIPLLPHLRDVCSECESPRYYWVFAKEDGPGYRVDVPLDNMLEGERVVVLDGQGATISFDYWQSLGQGDSVSFYAVLVDDSNRETKAIILHQFLSNENSLPKIGGSYRRVQFELPEPHTGTIAFRPLFRFTSPYGGQNGGDGVSIGNIRVLVDE